MIIFLDMLKFSPKFFFKELFVSRKMKHLLEIFGNILFVKLEISQLNNYSAKTNLLYYGQFDINAMKVISLNDDPLFNVQHNKPTCLKKFHV